MEKYLFLFKFHLFHYLPFHCGICLYRQYFIIKTDLLTLTSSIFYRLITVFIVSSNDIFFKICLYVKMYRVYFY